LHDTHGLLEAADRRYSTIIMKRLDDDEISQLINSHRLAFHYEMKSFCMFPSELSVPVEYIRQMTDELILLEQGQVDKTYETIRVLRQGVIHPKQVLTRIENFVDDHEGWSDLCHVYLQKLVSETLGIEMVLYKEKLNIKPPGGSGFAPHLDTPSLRIAFGDEGPQTFCTVMVAIDDMTVCNGCLRVCTGDWNEDNHVLTMDPEIDLGNPDGAGRVGAIPIDVVDTIVYESVECKGGSIIVFNGFVPHRSAANASSFPRRAVFLTFNPKCEGDFHKRYYEKMNNMRLLWRESESVKVASQKQQQYDEDARAELQAMSTIPK